MRLRLRRVVPAFGFVSAVPWVLAACFPPIGFEAESDGGASDAATGVDGTVTVGGNDGSTTDDAAPIVSDAANTDGGRADGGTDAAFPRTPVLDPFDRADINELAFPWSSYHIGIAANAAVFKPTAEDPSGGMARWDTVFGTSQEVFATIKRFPTTSGGEVDLFAKFSSVSTQGDCYGWDYYLALRIEPGGPGSYVEWCKPTDAGGKRDGASFAVTWANGDRVGMRVLSTNRVEVYQNGTLVANVAITDWPYAASGGQLGIAFARAGDATLDDFGGGTFAP